MTYLPKIGDLLKAIDVCLMDDEHETETLTIGDYYSVISITPGYISILDNDGDNHDFELKDIHLFFEIPVLEIYVLEVSGYDIYCNEFNTITYVGTDYNEVLKLAKSYDSKRVNSVGVNTWVNGKSTNYKEIFS